MPDRSTSTEQRTFVPSEPIREKHPHFDLSTIMGFKVGEVKVPKESDEMADAYLLQLTKDKTNAASKAELAWAFRRQLQEDLRAVMTSSPSSPRNDKETCLALLSQDPSHSFSLAIYRLLTKLGLHARFVIGHSVRTKSPSGEALLLESNRHAWAFVWDTDEKKWERLDATPAGDSNVDQEEQQAELGEGDYGEKEVELMTQEQLDQRLQEAKLQKQEQANPILSYANEAKCSPEEARDVIKKIDALRKKYSHVLADADRLWQTLVRKNARETIVDRGPVPLSQMDEMDPDEIMSGSIEMLAGEKDPLIGEREETQWKIEQWFGSYEVYIAADMSGSMDEEMDRVKKSYVQRDIVFLLVDSCMNAAVSAKKNVRKLKAPMPVKVSVVVFGEQTEIVMPLTEIWGPKEQIRLYRALNVGAGGLTPDHIALKFIEEQIARSLAAQDEARKHKKAFQKHGWKMRRFVIATADGGSDNSALVKQANERLKQQSIPVDLFFIAPTEDIHGRTFAESNYQSVTPVSSPSELAEKGLVRLTERIRQAYAKK